MRGVIQKKGKSYYAVVCDGIDPGAGRKRRRWVPAGTRLTEGERLLADLIRRKYEGDSDLGREAASVGPVCESVSAFAELSGTIAMIRLVTRSLCRAAMIEPQAFQSVGEAVSAG